MSPERPSRVSMPRPRPTARARTLVMVAIAGLLATSVAVSPAPARPVLAGAPSFYTKYVAAAGSASTGGSCTTPDFGPDDYSDGAEGAIEAAITAANSGGTVVLCDGTHSLTDGSVAVAFDAVTFQGESTTGTIVDGGDTTRLFDATGFDVMFIGLTLTGGNAGDANGGAVVAADVTVAGARLIANGTAGTAYVSRDGGAIYASGSVASSGTLYQDNTSGSGRGGAIHAVGSIASIRDTFVGNSSFRYGGAVYSDDVVTVTFATFSGNFTDYPGAAIYAEHGIDSSGGTYEDNSSLDDVGGALYAMDGTIASLHDVFRRNYAEYGGGAIYSEDGTIESTSGTYEDNTAGTGENGGAILAANGTVSSDHDRFSRNRADSGGAIYAFGDVDSTSGVYEDNTAGVTSGGAIYTLGSVTSHADRFEDNVAASFGGAIFASGRVESTGGTYTGNRAANDGGAISAGEDMVSRYDQFTANFAAENGGAIATSANVDSSGGTYEDNSSDTYGGAIYAEGAEPGVTSLHDQFRRNLAGSDGAAIHVSNGDIHSTSGTYEDNTSSSGSGGAMYAAYLVVSRYDQFGRNSAYQGGAIYSNDTVDSSAGIYDSNTSGDSAGAVYASNGMTSLGDVFANNTAQGGDGGGAIIAFGPVAVTEGTFTRNVATGFGGGIYVNSGDEVTLDRSTFAWNNGASFGGAVSLSGPTGIMRVTNSTFVENVSPGGEGGAIYSNGYLYATYSTFVDNTTGGRADAISVDATAYFDHVLIVGGETDCSFGLTPNDAGFSIETGYRCLTDDGSSTGNQLNSDSTSGTDRADLRLGTFANHGGRTWTYSLDAGSLAIDFDQTTGCSLATDQRGVVRPKGDGCDTGAYEFGSDGAAVPLYTGPWWINSSTAVQNLSLAAMVDPATAGCTVRFDVSGATWTTSGSTGDTTSFTTSGVSRSDGSVSAPLANVPLGIYDVTVTITGGCAGSGSDVGTLGVLPGTVARGTVGGGWYKLADAGGWKRSSFSDIVSVSSSYSKRTGITTTTTKGQLLWSSAADNSTASGGSGWRLRATISRSTTDGTSPWQPIACPAGVGTTGSEARCGRYSGTGLLEQRRKSGRWEPAPYGVSGRVTFTVTVYDGGRLTSCVRKTCKVTELADWFGITIVGVPTPTSPSDKLPQVGAPVKLKSGSLRNS